MEPKNFIHKHPLHFFEEWSNVHDKTRGVNCSSGCGQPISAQFYACIDCKFFLHKSCSELPLNITHPFHDNHPLTLLANAPNRNKFPTRCHFCGNTVRGFVYHCSSCKFDLDIKCALFPQFLNGDFQKVDHHIHVEHPFFFFENLSHEVKLASSRYCSVCLEQLSNASFYTCVVCNLFLHKSCSETELPLNINHPFHEKHTLTLTLFKWDGALLCQFCHNNRYQVGLFYHCSSCRFNLDIKSAFLPQLLTGNFPKVDHHIHVEHPLFFIENLSHEVKLASSRYCSVCLEQLSNASFYTCVVCNLFLHKSCSETELPLNINHPFHEKHTLTLTLLKWGGELLFCQFCHYNIRYPAGLFYHCSSCRFNLDIKCAFLLQFLTRNFPKRDHHFSNVEKHPLFLIQKDLISTNKVEPLYSYCFVCKESLLGSSFYYCPECGFFLHKSCAFEELPLEINHSLHDKHALTLTKSRDTPACKFCLNNINEFRYSCYACEFQLDPRCALLITKDLPKRDHHFSHVEHPLVFIQMLSSEVKINSSCSVCSKPLLGTSFYNCPDCQFFFHKECEAEFSTEIKHFAHPQHPLITRFSPMLLRTCHFCQGETGGEEIGYQCPSCDFYIHRKCTLPRFFPESKIHDHDHQLIPFSRENLFIICDACGGSGDSTGYFCVKCNLMVHRDCIFLPKLIRFKLHNHHILGHNYRFQQKEGEKWTCQFCFKKVVAEYGSYKCLHSDCNYVLHGSCVKKNKDRLYIEVESENEKSDEASSSSSSCAVVLGDKIKLFNHEHELVLDNEEIVTNGDKKCCDGCALPILIDHYSYSCPRVECNFYLHKACAQIGRHKPHWAFRDPLEVRMVCHFSCQFCEYDCSGFCFIREGVDGTMMKICLRCSEIDFITTHDADAQHLLFCDEDHKGPCSGCGKEMGKYGGYKCTLAEEEENCKSFALDYRCLTRPLTAEHRFHHHPLKLTYEDPYEDDGDPFQHMCEICEDRRDPKLWFYRCDECDFDAHPDCVLGEYPFIKRGSIYYDDSDIKCDSHHFSTLIYFQSEKYRYRKCDSCGDPCKDQLALRCPHSECNLAFHFVNCRNNWTRPMEVRRRLRLNYR